ncbi:winged helix-turn-helix domain-containing protein [Streptomyces sp. NY05-11A]|uniref:winged helix-turn-helix domain-containing protein n=1 Tax=Streptomyces soliscabiei TaxID=588897 RepID=UPI0029B20792|nr:hypothetical protein [Streptomyces sp. NY05-11A]MDX2681698.1 hypothetical protein [Streptomyces sp. NY05-11A]
MWGDRFVSEAAITTALRTARLAVGDTGGRQQLIRTVHRRGYQFVASVTVLGGGSPAGSDWRPGIEVTATREPIGADSQTICFCRAGDGRRIAYASVGTGAPLLKAANWMSHLDLEWTTPPCATKPPCTSPPSTSGCDGCPRRTNEGYGPGKSLAPTDTAARRSAM